MQVDSLINAALIVVGGSMVAIGISRLTPEQKEAGKKIVDSIKDVTNAVDNQL